MNSIVSNIIIIAILLVVVGLAVFYIYRAKKKGQKCIGCPASGGCKKCCSTKVKQEN